MFGDSDSEPPEGEQLILLVYFRDFQSNVSKSFLLWADDFIYLLLFTESEEDVEELERVHSPEVVQEESAGYYEQPPW